MGSGFQHQNLFVCVNFRTQIDGEANVGIDGARRFDISAVGLEHRGERFRHIELRITAHERCGVQRVVRHAVASSSRQRSAHKFAIRRSDFGNAGGEDELAPGDTFKFAPQRTGAANERHVRDVLEMRQANDSRRAV